MSVAGRQPQQDRSRATRQRLLDATIDSLSEVGWDRTTVVAVAARAGVSRGAAQHHFATRDELVVAAIDEVRNGMVEDMRARKAEVFSREDRPLAVLEMLAEMWSGRIGRAATHLWVAASTDRDLQRIVLPLEQRLNRDLYGITLELLDSDLSKPHVKESVGLTLQLMRGIGLGALLRGDLTSRRAELAQWATMLTAIEGVIGRLPV